MYVAERFAVGGSRAEWWDRLQRGDGEGLRSVATHLAAESGPLRRLLQFPPCRSDGASVIDVRVEVRPRSGSGGAVWVAWIASRARLEGEVTVVETVPGRSDVCFTAAYEPAWAATFRYRTELAQMAQAAGQAFLRRVVGAFHGATAAGPGDRAGLPDVRRRVLIEDEDPAWHRAMMELAGTDAYEFDTCPGPLAAPGGCPLLSGELCPKVEWADIILNSLDPDEPANRRLVRALKRAWPEASLTTVPGTPVTRCLTRRPAVTAPAGLGG